MKKMKDKNLFDLRKIFVFVVAVTLGLFPSGLASAEDATIVSVSTPSKVDAGEQFTVSIEVVPGTAIAGVQFDLSFDQSLVTVNSVAEDNLLSQGGAATYFNPGTINNTAGTISGVAGAIITPGQTVSTSGTFATITLTAEVTGGTCPLTLSGVVVGNASGQSVTVSVISGEVLINQPPALDSIGNKSVNEGELLEFTVSASDPDDDPLTFSSSSLPEGAELDPGTMIFSWTPRYNQAGIYGVQFAVSDGMQTDPEEITITVVKLYEDHDVNGDGSTNVLDMILIGQNWGETGLAGWIRADANEDGGINVLDMIIIGQNWTG